MPRSLLNALSSAFTGPLPNPVDSICLPSIFKITLASELKATSLDIWPFFIDIE